MFATIALFGAIAIALAYRLAPVEDHLTLLSTASAIILAYAVSAMALLPCFYYMFAFGAPHGLIFSPWRFSIDLVNFFVPTSINQLGTLPIFSNISYPYRAELAEATGYISLPSIAIVILFARERWHDWRGRFVVCMFIIACVLAMGPLLQVLGHFLLPLPAVVLTLVPLFDKALPSRFMMYAYLTLAVMVAMWLAEGNERTTVRWALGLAIVPFMLPNLSASFWTTSAETPAFFSNGLYRQYLAPDEAVLVLPFGLFGEGMAVAGRHRHVFSDSGGVRWARTADTQGRCGLAHNVRTLPYRRRARCRKSIEGLPGQSRHRSGYRWTTLSIPHAAYGKQPHGRHLAAMADD